MAAPSGKRKDSARTTRRTRVSDRPDGAPPGRGARGSRAPRVCTDLGDVPTGPTPLPRWYKAMMFGLLIVGLLWICVFYLTQGLFPLAVIGGWNLLIGVGLALIGFLMMSRWSE